jgi:hypothetical protein
VTDIVEDVRPPRFSLQRRKNRKPPTWLPDRFHLVVLEGEPRPLTRRLRIYRRRNGTLYFIRLYDDDDDVNHRKVVLKDERPGYDRDHDSHGRDSDIDSYDDSSSSDEPDDSEDSSYDRETAYIWVDATHDTEVLRKFKGRHWQDSDESPSGKALSTRLKNVNNASK